MNSDNRGNNTWDEWSDRVVSEVDNTTWLVNPREATRRTIAKAGEELARQSNALAQQHAFWTAQQTTVASQLDAEFAKAYPDLTRTDVERHAVGLALQKVSGDERFMKGIQNPATRPKALRAVAILASRELGRDDPEPARSAPTYLQSAVNIRTMDDGRNREALGEVIDHVRMTNRGFGG